MIRILLPAVLGLVAIVSLSLYEGFAMKDRWGEPGIEAKQLGERFANVPLDIGDWRGEDKPVDEVTRKTAGAVAYVNRTYTHVSSGKQVDLWLIVGHSRDIVRHTPNICYPSSGFHQLGSQLRQLVDIGDDKPAEFYTAKFQKENAYLRLTQRVFWAFNHPDINQWEAPVDGARWRYGLSKALYKLYFTSTVRSDEDTIEDNVAVEFAELMLPVIDEALFPTGLPIAPEDAANDTAASETAETAVE